MWAATFLWSASSESHAGNAGGALGQLGVGGHDAEPLLPRQRLLADLVPALIELALELGDPLLRRVVRCVRGAGRVVRHPRLLRRHRVQHADALDGVVGQIVVEEVVLRVVRRLDGLDALDDGRRPLAGVAADESVEVLEAQPGRPQVERSGLAAVPVGHVVILAVPGRVVAVLPAGPRRTYRRSSASACCSRGSRYRPP